MGHVKPKENVEGGSMSSLKKMASSMKNGQKMIEKTSTAMDKMKHGIEQAQSLSNTAQGAMKDMQNIKNPKNALAFANKMKDGMEQAQSLRNSVQGSTTEGDVPEASTNIPKATVEGDVPEASTNIPEATMEGDVPEASTNMPKATVEGLSQSVISNNS